MWSAGLLMESTATSFSLIGPEPGTLGIGPATAGENPSDVPRMVGGVLHRFQPHPLTKLMVIKTHAIANGVDVRC